MWVRVWVSCVAEDDLSTFFVPTYASALMEFLRGLLQATRGSNREQRCLNPQCTHSMEELPEPTHSQNVKTWTSNVLLNKIPELCREELTGMRCVSKYINLSVGKLVSEKLCATNVKHIFYTNIFFFFAVYRNNHTSQCWENLAWECWHFFTEILWIMRSCRLFLRCELDLAGMFSHLLNGTLPTLDAPVYLGVKIWCGIYVLFIYLFS